MLLIGRYAAALAAAATARSHGILWLRDASAGFGARSALGGPRASWPTTAWSHVHSIACSGVRGCVRSVQADFTARGRTGDGGGVLLTADPFAARRLKGWPQPVYLLTRWHTTLTEPGGRRDILATRVTLLEVHRCRGKSLRARRVRHSTSENRRADTRPAHPRLRSDSRGTREGIIPGPSADVQPDDARRHTGP